MQNVGGLKNAVAQLEESPQNSGPMRPNAPTGSPQTIRRRVYSHVWGFARHLEYHHDNLGTIGRTVKAAEEANEANAGPLYLDGGRDVPVTPPSQYPITKVLDPAPCGYRLTPAQMQMRAGTRRAPSPRGRPRPSPSGSPHTASRSAASAASRPTSTWASDCDRSFLTCSIRISSQRDVRSACRTSAWCARPDSTTGGPP